MKSIYNFVIITSLFCCQFIYAQNASAAANSGIQANRIQSSEQSNSPAVNTGEQNPSLKLKKAEPYYFIGFLTGGLGLSKFQEPSGSHAAFPSMSFGARITYLPALSGTAGFTFSLYYDIFSGKLSSMDNGNNRLHYLRANMMMTGKIGDFYLSGGLYGAYLFNTSFLPQYNSVNLSKLDFGLVTEFGYSFRLSETLDLLVGLEFKFGFKKAFSFNGKDYSNFSAHLTIGLGFSNGEDWGKTRRHNHTAGMRNDEIAHQRFLQKIEQQLKNFKLNETIQFSSQDTTLASEFNFLGQELDYDDMQPVYEILGSTGLESFQKARSLYRRVKAALVFTCILHPAVVAALPAHRFNARLESNAAASDMMAALNTPGDKQKELLRTLLYVIEKKRIDEERVKLSNYSFFGARFGGGWNLSADPHGKNFQFGFRYMYLVPFHGASLFKGGFTIDVYFNSFQLDNEKTIPYIGANFMGTVKIKSFYLNNGFHISFKLDNSASNSRYFNKNTEYGFITEAGFALGDSFKSQLGITCMLYAGNKTNRGFLTLLFHISFGY